MLPTIANPQPTDSQARRGNQKPQQFSLATLLLVTTLIAVCLALFRVSPVAGAAFLFLAAPALLRTQFLAEREKRHGGRLSAAEKVAVFLGSLAVALFVTWCAAVAFGATFVVSLLAAALVSPLGEPLAVFVATLGALGAVVASILMAGWMCYLSWPSREAFVDQLHREDQPRDPAGNIGKPSA